MTRASRAGAGELAVLLFCCFAVLLTGAIECGTSTRRALRAVRANWEGACTLLADGCMRRAIESTPLFACGAAYANPGSSDAPHHPVIICGSRLIDVRAACVRVDGVSCKASTWHQQKQLVLEEIGASKPCERVICAGCEERKGRRGRRGFGTWSRQTSSQLRGFEGDFDRLRRQRCERDGARSSERLGMSEEACMDDEKLEVDELQSRVPVFAKSSTAAQGPRSAIFPRKSPLSDSHSSGSAPNEATSHAVPCGLTFRLRQQTLSGGHSSTKYLPFAEPSQQPQISAHCTGVVDSELLPCGTWVDIDNCRVGHDIHDTTSRRRSPFSRQSVSHCNLFWCLPRPPPADPYRYPEDGGRVPTWARTLPSTNAGRRVPIVNLLPRPTCPNATMLYVTARFLRHTKKGTCTLPTSGYVGAPGNASTRRIADDLRCFAGLPAKLIFLSHVACAHAMLPVVHPSRISACLESSFLQQQIPWMPGIGLPYPTAPNRRPSFLRLHSPSNAPKHAPLKAPSIWG
ncbi:hypothetical protein C8R46DRAFT_1189457 [Mycena filopes]|nr:hypothetical protein C8R46DRAFT_1189457 [Mycena filopes]